MRSTQLHTSYQVKNLLLFCALLLQLPAFSKEGMWIPATLKSHERDMKAEGLEIPVDMIYNRNGTGLNNAVVLFGRGCTGELISAKGLVLTNHHCGYGSVQGLTSPDQDYFANGFWAMNMREEIPCKGLTVTFIRKMENVTGKILKGISNTMPDAERDAMIATRITATEQEFRDITHLDAQIKPYFSGNQYWVAITETFRDIRLVGFPPNGIGAFGGDVENWSWPRHTGDFSIFRVYAGADNKPADYATTNKPYNPSKHFNINIAGYKEGDFTMVYGFPGTTQEYISSNELKQVYSITDPISIEARTKKLDAWTRHMSASRAVFLKYTAKRAGVANGWKKWQGEVLGLKINNATVKKERYENAFQQWADKDKKAGYADSLLPQIGKIAGNVDELIYADQYNKEAALGIELIAQGAAMEGMIKCFRLHLSDSALRDTLTKVAGSFAGFYKNFDAPTDRDVFKALMELYVTKCAATLPYYYKVRYQAYNSDVAAWAEDVYNYSLVCSQDRLMQFATHARSRDSSRVLYDPAWQLYSGVAALRQARITPRLKEYTSRVRYLNRLYMQAQMAREPRRDFYPDANLTLRVTYGKVAGLDPDGPPKYAFQTRLGDAIALDDTTSDIFTVPPKLKQLYKAKDFGRWGVNGDVPLAFVAANHTSGGNSGSPVLNSKGELIGTNFDRAYEGTMSDYLFDPNRCRNISVDIRYTLFIIEKFGGAGWLIDEMSIKGKKKS